MGGPWTAQGSTGERNRHKAFLTSSPVMLMLLVQGPHLENNCLRTKTGQGLSPEPQKALGGCHRLYYWSVTAYTCVGLCQSDCVWQTHVSAHTLVHLCTPVGMWTLKAEQAQKSRAPH